MKEVEGRWVKIQRLSITIKVKRQIKMGIFKNMLGLGEKNTGKALDIVSDGVKGMISGLDHLKFSEEERAELNIKTQTLWIDTIKATANENTEQSKTRRFAAVSIITYCLLIITSVILLSMFGQAEKAKLITKICTDWWLDVAFITVITFFFGNHMIGSFQRNKK